MHTLKSLVYPAVALLSLAAAVSAHAESPTPDHSATMAFAQAKTRDQVQAELFRARAEGSTKVWSTTYNHMAAMKSVRSRAEVHAEAVAANMAGADSLWFGEDSGSFELARVQPGRAVAERIVASR